MSDKAGDFFIQQKRYAEGLELYQAALERFPGRVVFYQRVGCCAGHQGLYDLALEVSQRALNLEPDRQDLTNDLGWSLFEIGRLEEAEEVLLRGVAMDLFIPLECNGSYRGHRKTLSWRAAPTLFCAFPCNSPFLVLHMNLLPMRMHHDPGFTREKPT
ncbi:tetratricopeptide repeat protein [Desulfobulbus alkaliphilus]|uniref:tetratricopeptide repeat protein n=1 Tax=Desulfobulbus alkaliphilus TaxID=869814 RepID=UPI001964F64E|nr:tetratricopeptide repeat protein [Desulfobulbus alkaliphilus]MBM9538618.1 tetratricopeptide repeat protein [Desulfobulbus alkaliphilus]